MAKTPLNVGLVGYGFMGRAHSNGYAQVSHFFDLKYRPVLKAACGRDAAKLKAFADQWGYESTETDWRRLVERKDIDAIDVCTPNNTHAEIATAAAQAGKVVSPAACKEMLGHLKACDDKDKMTRLLPPGTVVAHKTGSVNASKTDAGIIYVPDPADKKKTHPVAVCVLTDENKDQRWVADNEAQVTIAKIARAVYDHFADKK